MKTDPLSEVEQKVFLQSIGHGGWDLYLGLLLAAIGVSALAEDMRLGDSSLWLVGIMAVAIALFYAAQVWIIRPRLGNVRFGARRKASLRSVGIIVGAAVLVGLLVWAIYAGAARIPRWTALFPVFLWVAVSLGGFSLAAYLLGLPQQYLYGLLYAYGFASLEQIQAPVTRALPVLGPSAMALLTYFFSVKWKLVPCPSSLSI